MLIQGVVPVDPVLARVALGRRKLDRISSAAARLARRGARSPELFERLLAGGRLGTFSDVSPDARRKPLPAATVVRAVARAAGVGFRRDALVYDAPIARGIRVLVLDTANRRGGADGLLPAWQVQWLRARLTVHRADRFLVVSPTPLERTPGGRKALAALDRASGVVAVLSGDTHRNLITPRRTSSGGYWLVRTSSLIDFPQQARALRLVALADGRVALETWMVDQAGAPGAAGVLGLAGISRELAFLDVQGGRPGGWRGGAADRNAMLFLP